MSRQILLATMFSLTFSAAALGDDGDASASGLDQWDVLTPLVEQFTADYPADREFATVAIGISHNGERRYWQVGEPIVVEGEPVPSESTLYQIGSVTKTFTGLLLADMVEEGLVSLDTTVGELAPDGVELSDDTAGITLRELATHTSGLPRISGDLLVTSLFGSADPYAEFDTEKLWNALSTTSIPARGDRTYSYSNLAMGLLGQLLADRQETDYAMLLATRITEPLRMHDTVIEFSEEQLARLAPGHGADGLECNIWTFDALAGCGALSSTSADLLTYLEFQMHPDDGPLGPAMHLSQEAHYEAPDSGLVLGLAWHMVSVAGPHPLIFHDGGTNGYVSFAGFIPATQTAVVVLCNSGDALSGNSMVGVLGIELLDASQAQLADSEDSEEATSDPAKVPTAQ